MKVICDRSALVDAVNNVTSVVAGRTPSPVLQCVKLTAEEGVLTLAATDLDVSLRIGVDQVDVQDPGDALIPADKLSQIVRNSEDPTLTLENEEHSVHIRGSDSHFTIYGYAPDEAPQLRAFDDSAVDCQIKAGVLQGLIQRTLFAAAAEHSRYAINGVLFRREGKTLRMVATDGRRLAMGLGSVAKAEGDSTCIVPAKALSLMSKLVRDPEALVKIIVDETQVMFRLDEGPAGAVLTSKLVEGSFPPFEDVIPKDQDKKAVFSVDKLRSGIRRAALLTNEESKGVRLHFDDGKLTLTSRAPDMGEAEVHVDAESYDGEALEIGFNPGFITDALKVIGEGEVTIELKEHNKPGVIKCPPDFTYVVMPVNLT